MVKKITKAVSEFFHVFFILLTVVVKVLIYPEI